MQHHIIVVHIITGPNHLFVTHPQQWRHNGRDCVSNHQPYGCLLNRLQIKENIKPRVTGLCAGNSPVTGEFPAQIASNAENVSIWWRHHVYWPGEMRMSCVICVPVYKHHHYGEYHVSSQPHYYIFVIPPHLVLLPIGKDRPVGQRGSLGGCKPSLDWPGEIHINCCHLRLWAKTSPPLYNHKWFQDVLNKCTKIYKHLASWNNIDLYKQCRM